MSGVIVVTGGSRGIGEATARLAAKRGYSVYLTYRTRGDDAAAVVASIQASGARARALECDTTREADIVRVFDTLSSDGAIPTAVVANAGITGLASRVEEADPETLRRVVDVNVTGAMLTAREAVRRMSTRRGGAGGKIVLLSSAVATLGAAESYVWYAASKAAVDSFTRGLAVEVAADGIRVNGVAPGLIDTTIHETAGQPDRVRTAGPQIPIQRAGAAEEVAEAILWLLSDKASYITGETLRVAGGR